MSEKVVTPQNQGIMGGAVPSPQSGPISTSDFDDAHGHARSGDAHSPTTPGRLGHGMSTNMSPHSYDPGQPYSPGCTHDTDGAFAWPDAPGGGLA